MKAAIVAIILIWIVVAVTDYVYPHHVNGSFLDNLIK